jgi:nitrogen PTS system EIIA component
MKISDYLDKNLIFFLSESSKEDALRRLVNDSLAVKNLPDRDKFFTAIFEREKIVSTGIGMGVAIPHAKLTSYHDFFIALGILEKGLEWKAIDNAPVRMIFLIGGPDDKQNEYLKILSLLTTILRDETLRKEMLAATGADEIIKLCEEL